MVERAVYRLDATLASPRVKVGADVLPWWPAQGVYLLVERGEAAGSDLVEVPGVAGAWSATGVPVEPPMSTVDNTDLHITYCFVDDDPVEVADRLRSTVEKRWADSGVAPLLAAPFYTIARPDDWRRHLT